MSFTGSFGTISAAAFIQMFACTLLCRWRCGFAATLFRLGFAHKCSSLLLYNSSVNRNVSVTCGTFGCWARTRVAVMNESVQSATFFLFSTSSCLGNRNEDQKYFHVEVHHHITSGHIMTSCNARLDGRPCVFWLELKPCAVSRGRTTKIFSNERIENRKSR